MKSDGTVIGRQFLKLPRLWARAKGLNQNIADLTAQFIINVAKYYISRVCAWNTSRLAYDGSGCVQRNEHNYSLCTIHSY